ncbi:MAG: hypothetical protein HGA97_12795, partial [Chlorobiaceae bacterium]|nr:hypothetical protein [Chlorobiaceae bacterium]
PSASDFAVMVNGTPVTVSSVGISQNKVSLNLASSIPDAATVSISYTDPTAGNDTNAIQDLNGNDASTMNSSSGGGSSDTTPPVLGSASVNGSSLTLTYNENLGPVPSGSAFTVMANGSQINVSGVSVYNGSMTLNLATSVYAGQTVTVSYTDPTTGNDANAIQDAAGNDASGFSGYVVTNNTSNTQFYLFHYTTGPVVAWAGSSWFHIDIMEDGDGNSRTWNANLVTIDQQNGNTRTESGTVLLLDTNNDGVLDHWGAWMTKSDTVPLMGDANHDGQPDGLFTDGAVEVPFVWQARDENGVVATFAFENENGVVSGSLFDLDGNGDPDYARVTENGVTTMQKITFVDTDGNGVDDTIDVLKASFYSGALQVNASNQPTGLWFSGENLANDSNTVAPVLSLDNSSVSIYHHKVACIIDGADADATDAEGDMLVFTLDGAPVDGTGHALFSIDAETGQISLTSAGATFIHDASLSDTFNLTVRVTDGVEAHDQTAALTVSLTNEAASYDCTMNVTYRNSGEGVEGVSAKLTDLSNQATSGADNGNGQYGYTGLTEGNYTLSTMKVATESDSDAITLDDVFETLWLVFDDQNSHTSTWQYLAADVSRDGFVGFRDVVGILKMALHREASPSGWAFVPASTGDEPMSIDNVSWPDATIPVTLDQDKEVDLVGVLLGDVDGSWGG